MSKVRLLIKVKCFLLLMLASLNLTGQTYVDIPWREGVIIKDGQETKGMIRLGGDLGAPWLNHQKVYFVSEADYDPSKSRPSNKVVLEYEPEDIQGYSTYTEDAEKNRIDLKFISGEITYMDGLAKKKKVVFLQELDPGAIQIYLFVPMPEKESSAQMQYEAGQRTLLFSTTYFKKGDSLYLSAAQTEIADLVAECPDVAAKVRSGGYGFTDLSQRTKKKGLGGLMASSTSDNELENSICVAIRDYNSCQK